MLNDDLQQNTQGLLGVNTYEPPIEQVNGLDDEGYFGKPDFYDYSEVQLPENYCYDEALLKEFNELAAKYNLSQKGANQLMSMAVKLTQLTGENLSKTIAEQKRQKINEYKSALAADREMGGSRYERTLRTANTAYNRFADADVRQILEESGLNCHPKFVRMFYEIGKQMQNDTIYGMGSAAAPKENREDILFPTMQ